MSLRPGPVTSCPALKSMPSISWALARHNRLVRLWRAPLGFLRPHTKVWFFFFFHSAHVKQTCPCICNNTVWPRPCRVLHSYISWCQTCQTLNGVNGTVTIKKCHWDSTTDSRKLLRQKRYGEAWYLTEVRTRTHCDSTDNNNVKDMQVLPFVSMLLGRRVGW